MKILFADDVETMRYAVSSALKNAGHDVETFTDGDELLERLLSGPRPDLVITDSIMIRVHGTDVLFRMRQDGRYKVVKSVPVIIFTTITSIKSRVEELGGMLVNKAINELIVAVKNIADNIAKKESSHAA